MSSALLIEIAWKSAACAGLTLFLLAMMRNCSAAQKSLVAHLGLLSLALLPLGTILLPEIGIAAPEGLSRTFSEASIRASGAAGPVDGSAALVQPETGKETVQSLSWASALPFFYGAPAAFLLLLTAVAVGRLQLLRFRSEVVTDPVWLTALASAQHRLGLKHGTALLTSPELRSPVSWGIIRPIIIIDPEVARDSNRAEAIIAHELAHVARLDWLALILGRVVIAFFWFNPLVWMLARTSHDLCEQAADDAVLRSNVPGADYADILVRAARHSTSPLLLAANGVAPSSTSLGRRVLNVLDGKRSRVPVHLGWLVTCVTAAFGLGTAMAAVQPQIGTAPAAARGNFGPAAAAELQRLDTPQTRAIARAISIQDWDARRSEGSTRFNRPEAAKPLISALRDQSPITRRVALWGLSEGRPAGAEAPVSGLLRDEVPEVRAEAARALGDLGAIGRSAEIARLLQDESPLVRRQAAHALGDLQDPATRPALEAGLTDSDGAVRAKVAWALKQVAEAEAILERYGRR